MSFLCHYGNFAFLSLLHFLLGLCHVLRPPLCPVLLLSILTLSLRAALCQFAPVPFQTKDQRFSHSLNVMVLVTVAFLVTIQRSLKVALTELIQKATLDYSICLSAQHMAIRFLNGFGKLNNSLLRLDFIRFGCLSYSLLKICRRHNQIRVPDSMAYNIL